MMMVLFDSRLIHKVLFTFMEVVLMYLIVDGEQCRKYFDMTEDINQYR